MKPRRKILSDDDIAAAIVGDDSKLLRILTEALQSAFDMGWRADKGLRAARPPAAKTRAKRKRRAEGKA